jgi:hypothetical protein
MEVIGYPITFTKWLKTISAIIHMSISKGTELDKTISDFVSVHQGCPLSMNPFVVYIEPLLTRLCQVINGVNLFGTNVSVRAMFNDVAIFISSDRDITNAGEVFDQF